MKRKTASDEPWKLLLAMPTKEGMEIKIGGENLLRNRKVKIEVDSVEEAKYSGKALTDGITDDEKIRWSSENNWENSEHWVEIQFQEKTTIRAMRLFWERLNVCHYALDSADICSCCAL